MSENISTKCHHQTSNLIWDEGIVFCSFYSLMNWVFSYSLGSYPSFRERLLTILASFYSNRVWWYDYHIGMPRGRFNISILPKNTKWDSNLTKNQASERNKKQCLCPNLSLMVAFGWNIFKQYYQRRYMVLIYDHHQT